MNCFDKTTPKLIPQNNSFLKPAFDSNLKSSINRKKLKRKTKLVFTFWYPFTYVQIFNRKKTIKSLFLKKNIHETKKKQNKTKTQVFWIWNLNLNFIHFTTICCKHCTSMSIQWNNKKQILTDALFTVWVPLCVWTTTIKQSWIQ